MDQNQIDSNAVLTKDGSEFDFKLSESSGPIYIRCGEIVLRITPNEDDDGEKTLAVQSYQSGFEDGRSLKSFVVSTDDLQDFTYSETPNGNLQINVAQHAKKNLQEILDGCKERDHEFLEKLLEEAHWSTNDKLFSVSPFFIGALTDAPIISDQFISAEEAENSEYLEDTNFWWYPNYQILSFAEELIEHGTVTFQKVPKN